MWTCEKFSRGQAWVDLLLLANYDYGFFYVRDIKVDVQRGQVAWSEPKLASRWGWSRTKVRKFLNDLEKEQQLIQQKNNVTQIITIVNYEIYQEKEQQEDSRKTAGRQQEDPNKKNKEESKKNNNIEDREKKFYESLVPFVEKYGKDMIRDFYKYWSEPNSIRSKMRFELEKTWDISRRLERWRKNNEQKIKEVIPVYEDLSIKFQ